jgi:hypothetical protein
LHLYVIACWSRVLRMKFWVLPCDHHVTISSKYHDTQLTLDHYSLWNLSIHCHVTEVCHWILPATNSVCFTSSQHLSFSLNVILPIVPRCVKRHCPSLEVLQNYVYAFLLFFCTYPPHLTLCDLITFSILCEECEFYRYALCFFYSSFILYFLSQNLSSNFVQRKRKSALCLHGVTLNFVSIQLCLF